MVVRELVALLGIKTDTGSFQKAGGGLDGLAGKLKEFALGAATAFASFKTVKWLWDAAKGTAELAHKFDILSQRTGIGFETLQRFGYAAEMSGADISDVSAAVRKLQIAMNGATEEGKGTGDTFAALGVSARDQNGNMKKAEDLMLEISDAMGGVTSDAERTAIAVKLFGKGGMALIPMLKAGKGGLREMMQAFDETGAMISKEDAPSMIEFAENMHKLEIGFGGVKRAIGSALLPALSQLQDRFMTWWKANQGWAKENIAKIFGRIGETVVRLGNAFRGLYEDWQSLSDGKKKAVELGGAFTALGLLIASGPIGQVAALAIGITKITDEYQRWLEEAGKEQTTVFGEMVGSANETQTFWDQATAKVIDFADYLTGGLSTDFDSFFSGLFKQIMTFQDLNFSKFISAELDIIRDDFQTNWDACAEIFYNALRPFGDFVKHTIDNISDVLGAGLTRWTDLFSAVGISVSTFFSGIWQGIKDGFSAAFAAVVGVIDSVLAKIASVPGLGKLVSGFLPSPTGLLGTTPGVTPTPLASTIATAGGPTSGATNNATTANNVNVVVHANTNASAGGIGKAVAAEVQKVLNTTARALGPAPVPAGG